MPDAYQYQGQRLTIMQNQNGMDEHSELVIPERNQFAEDLDHMADCVMTGREPRTPGEEGLQDQVIMDAVNESARTGREVALKDHGTLDTFRGPPLAATG